METASPTTLKRTWTGLTPEQVLASRQQHGTNVLTPPVRDPWWKLYLSKYDDPVIRILLIAAFIAIAVGIFEGRYAEGIGIIIAILLATTLAFVNEYRAEKEFGILNTVNDHVPVKVVRESKHTTVPKCDVVVGDIVLVEIGDEVPADGRVLEAVALCLDEAKLTGESLPVKKVPTENVKRDSDTAFPLDVLLRSTMVADGHGVMEVAAVGDKTEIGKTAQEATASEEDEQTPLNAQLERLSKLIGVVGFGVAALTFAALVGHGALTGSLELSAQQWVFSAIMIISLLAGLIRIWLPIVYDLFELTGAEYSPPAWLEKESLRGWIANIGGGALIFVICTTLTYFSHLIPSDPKAWLPVHAGEEFLKYFMIAVTLIVVAVPEGLAMSVTLSLAYSMRKMTATNNLVRRMHACETIGAATVICSDKTGTLTMNKMRVVECKLPGLPEGLPMAGSNGSLEGIAGLIVEAISANSTANLDHTNKDAVSAIGNPTEGALLYWLHERGIDYAIPRTDFQVEYQLTFSTERKWMGTLGRSQRTGQPIFHVKGAPEIILGRCSNILTENGKSDIEPVRDQIVNMLHDFQMRGMRTLAFAYRETDGPTVHEELDAIATELTWLGFVAIADPIRPDVPPAIKACRDAGIEVKIITGDSPQTAREIGAQIGLVAKEGAEDALRIGRDFEVLSDDDASSAVDSLRVLARARPIDKMRVVRLLQSKGHVVAVTGDGTNDAPMLRHANVGLAMGRIGTDAAKEASDIVLLDDSFNSIVSAVMWGRSLYENIQRFVLFQLTINVAALGIAFLGPFIGVELPLTVTQMLWVNLIMDTFAALALATEPPHWNVMKRPPRNPKDFIVTPAMARGIFGAAGVFLLILVSILLYVSRDRQISDYELSVFFTVFVLLQFWNLFNARCLGRNESAFRGLKENKAFIAIASAIFVGQVLLVQFGSTLFRTVPLSLTHWVIIIATTSCVLWVGEIRRWTRRSREVPPGRA